MEYAYNLSKKSVTLIAHSMGGPMTQLFLQSKQQSWKDNYIAQVVTLNSPWGGTAQTIEAITVGYDLGEYILPNYAMKAIQRSCPSLAWLLPSPYYWKQNEILVKTSTKNYTMANIDEFLM